MTLIRNLKTSLRNFMFLCMAILRLHTLCLPLVSQVHPDYFFVFVLHILCMAILRPLTLYFHPIFHFVFVFGYPTPIHPVFTIGFTSSPYLCFLFFLFHNLCTAILRLLTAYFHLFFDLCFVYGFMYIYFPILIAYTFWFCVWLSYVTQSHILILLLVSCILFYFRILFLLVFVLWFYRRPRYERINP